jgi:hypothetical protein
MKTKQELFRIELHKYLDRSKEEKKEILNGLERQTGMHRKSIIRKFRREQLRQPGDQTKSGRRIYYGIRCTSALKEIWEASGELCGELVHPIINQYIDVLTKDNMWDHGDEVTGKLRSMGLSTVKRRISLFVRTQKGKGVSTTKPSTIKERIPVFCGPWRDVPVGHGQIDTVVHCGSTLVGDMIYTVSFTDVASGWFEGVAQFNKGMQMTRNSLGKIGERLPFSWFHAHPDCGSEFLNQFVIVWAEEQNMELTRSRSYHKNDNTYVEQKNGHIVRKELGYVRLDCQEVLQTMNKLYTLIALHRNYFTPQRKLISREKHGARYKRKYDQGKTPYKRVLSDDSVSLEAKYHFNRIYAKLNPVKLREDITRLKSKLFKLQRIHGTDIR